MSDITKCDNKTCSLNWNCWRFNAPDDKYQSYSTFEQDKDGNCEMYWNQDKLNKTKDDGSMSNMWK